MTNQEKIESVRRGVYAWRNDGTLVQLKEVLKITWPKDEFITGGGYKFYYKNKDNFNLWDLEDTTDLPTHSIKDFFNTDDNKTNKRKSLKKLDNCVFGLKLICLIMSGIACSLGRFDIGSYFILVAIYLKK